MTTPSPAAMRAAKAIRRMVANLNGVPNAPMAAVIDEAFSRERLDMQKFIDVCFAAAECPDDFPALKRLRDLADSTLRDYGSTP